MTFVAIYSALGLRDAALNDAIGRALRTNSFPGLKHLQLAPHERDEACWLHWADGCFTTASRTA